jgi:hypothetical protein
LVEGISVFTVVLLNGGLKGKNKSIVDHRVAMGLVYVQITELFIKAVLVISLDFSLKNPG